MGVHGVCRGTREIRDALVKEVSEEAVKKRIIAGMQSILVGVTRL